MDILLNFTLPFTIFKAHKLFNHLLSSQIKFAHTFSTLPKLSKCEQLDRYKS